MISVIGLGNAASAIVDCFKDTPQYDVFKLNDQVKKSSKYNFKIKSFDEPEQYEANIPNLQKFFSNVNENVQFFVVGGSYSSNYSLGVLEQLRDKKVDLIYVQPDTELLDAIEAIDGEKIAGMAAGLIAGAAPSMACVGPSLDLMHNDELAQRFLAT